MLQNLRWALVEQLVKLIVTETAWLVFFKPSVAALLFPLLDSLEVEVEVICRVAVFGLNRIRLF
jgi:hypothetical protein